MRNSRRSCVSFLLYHYIRDDHNPRDPVGENLSVSPALFEQQMHYLSAQGYTPINQLYDESESSSAKTAQ